MASPSISPRQRTWIAAALACSLVWVDARASADEPPVFAQAPGAPALRPKATAAPPAKPQPAPAAPEPAAPASAAAPSPEAAAPAPAPEPPPPEAAAPTEDAPAESELETPSEPAMTTSAASVAAKAELQKRMQALERERASTTNFLPWLTVGVGAGITLLATTVGAVNAFDCEPDTSCIAPPWASFAVVLGAAIGSAGAVWLVRKDDDIRELEAQRNQLQLDIDRLEFSRHKRSGFARAGSPQVSMRFSF